MQLYYNEVSAPCRAVMLLMHTLQLTPEWKLINMENGDHMTPEYLKMNPQHTIPVLVDDGFVLSESRAILGYLAEKYAPDMTYYPSDPMARGVVNQRLMFDLGTLYQRTLDAWVLPVFAGEKKASAAHVEKMKEALGWLEMFLGDAPYMAGDKITIADYSLMATISSIDGAGMDLSPYPKIWAWFMKCKGEMRHYEEANGKGAQMWGAWIKNSLEMK